MKRPFKWENFRFVSDIKPPSSEEKIFHSSLLKSSLFKKKNPLNKKDLINSKPKINSAATLKEKKRKFTRNLALLVSAFILIGGIMFFSSLHSYQQEISRSLSENLDYLREKTETFSPLNQLNSSNSAPPTPLLKTNPTQEFASKFLPVLKQSIETYKDFQGLSSEANSLFNETSKLVESLPNLIFKQKGAEIIASLESINSSLKLVIEKNSSLASKISSLQDFAGSSFDFYLPFQADLSRYQSFLESLIFWLKSENNRHLLVLFLNPSELRPGGGFLGSYAHVVLNQGNVQSIEVHDVNDIDRTSSLKVIPPKPIQAIATRWKTADANWFFDFPSSARTILQFSEGSDLYKKSNIVFDGVFAVSANVVGDILNITGPVELKEAKTTLNKDDFLYEIQKEIQTNRAGGDSYPKKILQEATPFILERISNLDSNQKSQLLSYLQEWFSKKDLMIYFRDQDFQKFFNSLNISGGIYEIPNNFFGDYLAVVNANLGGGKTDIFINQSIELQSQLNEDGTVTNKLKIIRDHTGDEAKSWWYRVPNQNYLSVYTPESSRLDDFSGGIAKTIKPPVNYSSQGYLADPLVSEIELTENDFLTFPNLKSFKAFGKNIFSTWTKTDIGKKSEVFLEYVSRLPAPLEIGGSYQFIFERQSSASGNYKFDISAPIGFVWEENNLPIYEYKSSDPPGRLVINLTLKKPD